jgi:hypothetical protein
MKEEVCGMELINLRDSYSAFYIKFRVSSEPSMLHKKAPKSGCEGWRELDLLVRVVIRHACVDAVFTSRESGWNTDYRDL